MARSKYIYHIWSREGIIASFTVKAEAYAWMAQSRRNLRMYTLTRVRDGIIELGPTGKNETEVEWL